MGDKYITLLNISKQGRIQLLSKVGVHFRHTITRGFGGHYKYSAFPVNLTPLSRNNFVLNNFVG